MGTCQSSGKDDFKPILKSDKEESNTVVYSAFFPNEILVSLEEALEKAEWHYGWRSNNTIGFAHWNYNFVSNVNLF